MATTQTLVVNILGNARQLSQSAKRAQADVRQLEMRVTSSVGGIVRQFAGLAGIAGLSYMAQQSFAAIDANAKLADSLGTTTQALTALHHAGNLSGVSTETFNGSLQKLSKNLGEAVTKGGASAAMFARLGLDAQQLAGMDPAAAFVEIAEVINRLPTASQKSAAAIEIFGRQGQMLLPLIAAGKQGIGEMTAEADRLGVTFSRFDAQQIEAANDAMYRLKQAVTGAAQALATTLAPILVGAAQMATEAVVALRRWGPEAFAAAKHFLAIGAALVIVRKVMGLVEQAQALIAKRQLLINALSGPKGWIALASGVAIYVGALAALDAVQQQGTEAINALPIQAAGSDAASAAAGIETMSAALSDTGDAAANSANFLDKYRTSAESVASAIAEIDRARNAGIIGEADAARARQQEIEKATGIFSQIRAVRDELELLQGVASETDHQLRDLIAKGAPQQEVDRLRQLIEMRDQLKAQQQTQRDNAERSWSNIGERIAEDRRAADQIRERVKTPQQRFKEEVAEIQRLRGVSSLFGGLDPNTAQLALQQARDKLLSETRAERRAERPATSALDVRSQEGLAAFNRLFKPTAGTEDNRNLDEQSRDLLAKIEQGQNRLVAIQQRQQRPIVIGQGR